MVCFLAYVTDEHAHSHILLGNGSRQNFLGHEMYLDGFMEKSYPMKVLFQQFHWPYNILANFHGEFKAHESLKPWFHGP